MNVARRADLVVAAAARRRRVDGGDAPAGGGAAGADGTADQQRTRRRRATQPQESKERGGVPPSAADTAAATELRDGKDLAALFAAALAPSTMVDPRATAAQQQPVKRVVRKRKTVASAAAAPRSDPWATYTGLFEVAALQQARQQEARRQKKQGQQQQQPSQTQQQQPSQQQHQQPQQAKQQEAKGEQQQQWAKGQQQPSASTAPRRGIPGARRVGGLFVQRLPTGVPLVPAARVPVAVQPLSGAQAAAQQLAKGLLGGVSQPAAVPSGQQRVYVPQAPAPPTLVQSEDAGASRWDARSEALRRMRMRTIRQYGETIAGALEWAVDGRQLLFSAPTHLPVAVQRGWASIDVDGAPELTSLLPALSREVQRALGVALPERALRGERGAVLATATPRAVGTTLQEWVSVCGADYARQLLEVEPCILVLPPSTLLETLEALNRHMGLEPSDAVAFVLRHPALMGLRPDELAQQMEALGAAVGLTPTEARALAMERPELLLYTEVELTLRMQALQRLLPGATSKLPAMVARRPTLLLRSPRALARDIRQLANTLGLTDWAAARLVVGGPAILELSLATLARRLERLKALCSSHPKWQQQLTAMSPAGLGRCLRCSDATFDRLSLLLDAGMAGSPRLPKVKRILTLPAGWFEEAFDALKAGRAATLASRSTSDAAAGGAPAGDDSDDEDDSGLLWPPEQDSGSGDGSGRRGASASVGASSEPNPTAAADPAGTISTGAGKSPGSSISSSRANGADVAGPALSAAAV